MEEEGTTGSLKVTRSPVEKEGTTGSLKATRSPVSEPSQPGIRGWTSVHVEDEYRAFRFCTVEPATRLMLMLSKELVAQEATLAGHYRSSLAALDSLGIATIR